MPVRMQDQSEITQPKYYTPNVKCKTPYQRNIASVPLQCRRDKGHLAFLELINSSLTSNTKYFLSFSDMFCKYVCVYIWNHIHNRFSVTQHLLADVASQTLMFSPKREALTLSHSLTLSSHCLDLSSCASVFDPFPTACITNWHSLHKDFPLSFMINVSLWLPGPHCCCGRLWSYTFSFVCILLSPNPWSDFHHYLRSQDDFWKSVQCI